MFRNILDLNQPEERFLNEALTAYTRKGFRWDHILYCLRSDFPMMDDIYMAKAELALFKWFRPDSESADGPSVLVNRICFFESDQKDDPENSWNRKQFLRRKGEHVNGAIQFTNLRYMKEAVHEKYNLYASLAKGEEHWLIKEIEVVMEPDQLRKTMLFSADLDSMLSEKVGKHEVMFSLEKEDRPVADEVIEYLNIGQTSGVHVTKWIFHSERSEESSESFDLNITEEIQTEICMECNCRDAEGKRPERISAQIVMEYSDPHRDEFMTDITLSHVAGNIYRYSGGIVRLNHNGEESYGGNHIPVYNWDIGTYKVSLFVWNNLKADKNISFLDKTRANKDEEDKKSQIEGLIMDFDLEEKDRNFSKALHLERFAFYPVMNENKEFRKNLICPDETLFMTSVRPEHIRTLGVNARFTIKDERDDFEELESHIRCLIYDQTGRLLDTSRVIMKIDGSDCHIFAALGSFTSYKWQKGKYRIELKFQERCIATAIFEVGDKERSGEYDADRIRENLKKASQQESSVNAYAELMGMTGLESVKETIMSMRNTAVFTRQRKDAGLPGTSINLHACFIGNPGTGKTTVARLIGQIYRDLGLLSSGHVVEESRRTLVGRYYDSESKALYDAIERARGGILLIDDASNLYIPGESRDPGNRIIEYLLAELEGEENKDWMLILAGSDPGMTDMLNHNRSLLSRIHHSFIFKDYEEDQLLEIAEGFCRENRYVLSNDARIRLTEIIRRDMSVKDETFGNGRYVMNLMNMIVNVNMAGRVGRIFSPDKMQLQVIEACDVPGIRRTEESRSIKDLKDLIGLEPIKRSIESHINYVKMLNMRTKMGLDSSLPPLHMIFTGNPGTGKTTVADLLGEIYASMGVLSRGDVLYVERKNLVGTHIGQTEDIVSRLLKRAKGNILFIDEAYQLYSSKDSNDYGKVAMECLLTELAKDSTDMIVIMAGYEKEMKDLIEMNTGISSRFPYTFHFEDYSIDELVSIASHIVTKQNYRFTPEAMESLKFITKTEIQKKEESFGNARFIKKLITNRILPAMADRLAAMENPSEEDLMLITSDDIPMTAEQKEMMKGGGFNEKAIADALAELDSLTGLKKVKTAIHDFVDIARYLNSNGERFTDKGILKWSFTGNTGTGKSTVAAIMAKILKAMNLLSTSEITEVKGEEIFNIPEFQCDEVLRNAMRKARYGLLLIDGDSPDCINAEYRMSSAQLRAKLTSITAESGGAGAVVIAEGTAPRRSIASSLAINGVYSYDHTFIFDDYQADELYQIFESILNRYGTAISSEAADMMSRYICDLHKNKETGFANASTMDHLAHTVNDIVILRLSRKGSGSRTAIAEDVESFVWKKQYTRIGY